MVLGDDDGLPHESGPAGDPLSNAELEPAELSALPAFGSHLQDQALRVPVPEGDEGTGRPGRPGGEFDRPLSQGERVPSLAHQRSQLGKRGGSPFREHQRLPQGGEVAARPFLRLPHDRYVRRQRRSELSDGQLLASCSVRPPIPCHFSSGLAWLNAGTPEMNSWSATTSSRRPRWEPRQRWMPAPNAR